MYLQGAQRDRGTEWDEIQRGLGNRPQLEEDDEEQAEEEVDYGRGLKSKSERLKEKLQSEGASYEKVREHEDDIDDDAFFEEYRKKRLAELQAKAMRDVYGELVSISEPEYKDVVNTKNTWVVVFLYKPSMPPCQLVNQILQRLAATFKSTRFVKIYSEEAIHNYPDKNLPTLLIYYNGELKKQFVGLASLGRGEPSVADVEWRLKQVGAVESDLEEDPSQNKGPSVRLNYVAARSRPRDDDEDY